MEAAARVIVEKREQQRLEREETKRQDLEEKERTKDLLTTKAMTWAVGLKNDMKKLDDFVETIKSSSIPKANKTEITNALYDARLYVSDLRDHLVAATPQTAQQ